jgi:hypothetical protein
LPAGFRSSGARLDGCGGLIEAVQARPEFVDLLLLGPHLLNQLAVLLHEGGDIRLTGNGHTEREGEQGARSRPACTAS